MKIIHEDKHIIVVEKEQNVSVQGDHTLGLPLIEEVRDYFEFKMGIQDPYVGLIHRLDRHTGGIVVFAKNQQANRTLSAIFASHNMTKKYLALVEGVVLSSTGSLSDYLVIDSKRNVVRIAEKDEQGAKLAKLDFRVIETRKTPIGMITALEINLFTGRQHQIRVQLAKCGHPIIGDVKYGSRWPDAAKFSMALWAIELSFNAFGLHYSFRSGPPDTGLWLLLK